MAIINGVDRTLPISTPPAGLLGVAHVHDDSSERVGWERGFSALSSTAPEFIHTLNREGDSIHPLTGPTGLARYRDVEPILIEIRAHRSAIDIESDDPFLAVRDQIEAATQVRLERELWLGDAAKALGTAGLGQYLTRAGSTVLTSAAVDAARGLQLIEQSIGEHPLGAAGVIHMTRDVASALGSRLSLKDGVLRAR